jgi:hypothetical protein
LAVPSFFLAFSAVGGGGVAHSCTMKKWIFNFIYQNGAGIPQLYFVFQKKSTVFETNKKKIVMGQARYPSTWELQE